MARKELKNSKILKHVAIDNENYETLRKRGRFGMTFNDIMTELLNSYRNTGEKEKN
jgi:hypothetical protein